MTGDEARRLGEDELLLVVSLVVSNLPPAPIRKAWWRGTGRAAT